MNLQQAPKVAEAILQMSGDPRNPANGPEREVLFGTVTGSKRGGSPTGHSGKKARGFFLIAIV